MEQKEKDLIIALVNGLQGEIDALWDKVEVVHTEVERVDRSLKLWAGRWEEENCEGGGKAPKTV